MPVTSNIANRLLELKTVVPDVSPLTMLFPTLKTPAEPPSRTKGTGEVTVTLYRQALTIPSAVAVVIVPSCPAVTLSATNEPTVGIDHFFIVH